MVDHDPDFWPTIEEADMMLLLSELSWSEQEMKLLQIDFVGQDMTEIMVACDKCYKVFEAPHAVFEKVDRITHKKCPKCLTSFKELTEPK